MFVSTVFANRRKKRKMLRHPDFLTKELTSNGVNGTVFDVLTRQLAPLEKKLWSYIVALLVRLFAPVFASSSVWVCLSVVFALCLSVFVLCVRLYVFCSVSVCVSTSESVCPLPRH